MATEPDKHVKKMHPDDVDKFVRKHEDPGVTTAEVAESFDVSRKGAYYRLKQLEERKKIRAKEVGKGLIWFPVG